MPIASVGSSALTARIFNLLISRRTGYFCLVLATFCFSWAGFCCAAYEFCSQERCAANRLRAVYGEPVSSRARSS